MKTSYLPLILLAFGCSDVSDQKVADSGIQQIDLATVAEQIADNSMTEDEFLELDKEFYGDSPVLLNRGSCTQTVEKANLSGDTYSSTHYQDTWCDGDGSDVDWLYDFYPSWSHSPDDFHWYASNWWVRTVFGGAYSSELIGYSLCSSPVQLCVGTTGVSVAGGHNVVANSLFISH